jgi:hypothetical protein
LTIFDHFSRIFSQISIIFSHSTLRRHLRDLDNRVVVHVVAVVVVAHVRVAHGMGW